MDKAKIEAHQAISIIESQLKFRDKAECLHVDEKLTREYITCTPEMNRTTLARIAEEELMYLQKLPPKEKSIEVDNHNCIVNRGFQLLANFRLVGSENSWTRWALSTILALIRISNFRI